MSDLFGNTSFEEPKKPGVDNELNEFLMMEKQKAQLTAQVNYFNYLIISINTSDFLKIFNHYKL